MGERWLGLALLCASILLFVGLTLLAWWIGSCWMDGGFITASGCWGRG